MYDGLLLCHYQIVDGVESTKQGGGAWRVLPAYRTDEEGLREGGTRGGGGKREIWGELLVISLLTSLVTPCRHNYLAVQTETALYLPLSLTDFLTSKSNPRDL